MIKHFISDVDGVLNTGHFYYTEEGKFMKCFGPHDKDGVKLLQKEGITIDFITADATGFSISEARIVKDWGLVGHLHLVSEEERLEWIQSRFDLNEVAYMGDGIHDVPILLNACIGFAPASARKEARYIATYVTESPAGSGAFLDAAQILIKRLKNVR